MSVRRLWRLLLAATAAALVLAPAAPPPPPSPVSVQLARFGGGAHFGGFGSRVSRPRAIGRIGRTTTGRSRGILRRIGHALAFAAVLHFLFAGSHGGGFVFLLLLILALLFLLLRRRRRRRVYYQRY